MSFRVAWLGGWAVAPEWIAESVTSQFPDLEHSVFIPEKGAVSEIAEKAFDAIVGYSLGSLLLLEGLDRLPPDASKVFMAPIFDFKKEANLGGQVNRTQLKVMQRWLNRDPIAAIDDFYKRAGVTLQTNGELPYSLDALGWGLDALTAMCVPIEKVNNVSDSQFVLGADDVLLNAATYQKICPAVEVVPSATHDFKTLLGSLKFSH